MAEFLTAVLQESMKLFPAKNSAWTYVNMETGFSTGQFNTSAWQQVAMKHLDAWNRHSADHPIIRYFSQPDHRPISRMSDFISEDKLSDLQRDVSGTIPARGSRPQLAALTASGAGD